MGEVRIPVIRGLRFFSDLYGENPRVLRQLAHKAISGLIFLPNEAAFALGDPCSRTLFVESGMFTYTRGVLDKIETMVRKGPDGTRSVRSTDGAPSGQSSVAIS